MVKINRSRCPMGPIRRLRFERSWIAEALGRAALRLHHIGSTAIPGRRYFRRDDTGGDRVCNVHAFLAECDDVRRHLQFRDYLRAHREEAEEYARLTIELAKRFATDIEGYMDE